MSRTREGKDYTFVKLVADREDEDTMIGKYQPQRIMAVEPTTSTLLINSRDRLSGTDFDFIVDIKTEAANYRTVSLRKIIHPLLPQINANNRTLTVEHVDGIFSTTLDCGYYTVQSFVNMLQAKLTAGWVSLDATNSVTVAYDANARLISVTDNNGEAFFFQNTSSFIVYGYNVVGFPSQAPGSALSTTTISSTNLTMIYSRFVTIRSDRITESQRGSSIISSTGASNIVAVVDLAEGYNDAQFATGSAFPGTAKVFDTDFAPTINVLNRGKTLRILDVEIVDEFGFGVTSIYSGTGQVFEYPVVMWFLCAL